MNLENCIQFRGHCDLANAELRKLHDIVNIARNPGMVAALNRHQLEENITILEVNYMKVWSTGHLLREAVNSLINSVKSELCQQQDNAPLVSHDTSVTPKYRPVETISLAVQESALSLSPEVSLSLNTNAPLIRSPLSQANELLIKRQKDCINKDVQETPTINNLAFSTKSKLKSISEYNPATETDTSSRINRKRIYEKIVEEILHPAPQPFTKKLTDAPTRAQTRQNKYLSQEIVVSDYNALVSAPSPLASSNNIPAEKFAKGTFSSVQPSPQEGSLTNRTGIQHQLNLPVLPAYYAQNEITSSPLIMDSVASMMLSSNQPIHFPTPLSNSNPAFGVLGLSLAAHLQPPVVDAGGPIYGLVAKTTLAPVQGDVIGASFPEQSNSFALLPMWHSERVPKNRTEGTDTSQLQINSRDGVWGPGFITHYQQSNWPVGHNKNINNVDCVSLEIQAVASSAMSTPQLNHLRCCPQCGVLLPDFIDFPDPQFFIRGGLPLPYHQLGSMQAEWPTAFFVSVCGAAPQTVYLDRHGMVSIYGGRDLPADMQRTRLSKVHHVLYPWKGNGTPYSFQYEATISISVGGVITCNQKVGLVRTLQQGLVLGRDFVESHTVWVERVDATSGWIHIDGHAFPCYRAKKAYKSLNCQQPVINGDT